MLRLFSHKHSAVDESHKHKYKPSPPRVITVLDDPNLTRASSLTSSIAHSTDYEPVSKLPAGSWYKESQYGDYDIPHLVKTPWELERHKRKSIWNRSNPEREVSTYTMKKLPAEVYECIVSQFEGIHLEGEQACTLCYLRDMYNLALTSRAWEKAARAQLYRKIYLPTSDKHSQLPRPKTSGASRLKLLRRTLRHRGPIARSVRELHLSEFQTLYKEASIDREEILNLVASLVLACPLLERVVGFHVPFTQSFDRLSYALSSRSNLKERVWLLSDQDTDDSDEDDIRQHGHYFAERDPTERFLELNSRHPNLTTLVLHQENSRSAMSLNFRSIVGTFRQLPCLQHLTVSGLPSTSFTNITLNALPTNLQSLRLDNLPGINDKGLQRFITSQSATSIKKLTLVNLEIASLITISNVLSEHLSVLKRFTLIQHKAPSITSRAPIPDFSSPTLEYLHIELRSQAGPMPTPFSDSTRTSIDHPPFPFTNSEPISCLAISLLATSITDNAFPSLRRIRVPHDPQGVIQSLCKPRASALLSSDSAILAAHPPSYCPTQKQHTTYSPTTTRSTSLTSHPSSRADSAIGSPTFPHASLPAVLTPARSRLAAQTRILAARQVPRFTLKVWDPEGAMGVDTSFAGYIGQVGSQIVYDLEPDLERTVGTEDAVEERRSEWVVGIHDLVYERSLGRERGWGSCGHGVSGRLGGLRVNELF